MAVAASGGGMSPDSRDVSALAEEGVDSLGMSRLFAKAFDRELVVADNLRALAMLGVIMVCRAWAERAGEAHPHTRALAQDLHKTCTRRLTRVAVPLDGVGARRSRRLAGMGLKTALG